MQAIVSVDLRHDTYYISSTELNPGRKLSSIKRYWKELVTWALMVIVLVVVLSQKISIIWTVEQTVMWKDVFVPTFQAASPVVSIIVTHYLLGRKIDALRSVVDTLSGKLGVHHQASHDDSEKDSDNDCPNNPTSGKRHRKATASDLIDLIGLIGIILGSLNMLLFTFFFIAEARTILGKAEILLMTLLVLLVPAISGVLSYRLRQRSPILALMYALAAAIPWIMILVFLVSRH